MPRQSYEENLRLARLHGGEYVLEAKYTYLLEPGDVTIQTSNADIDIRHFYDSGITEIEIRSGETVTRISYDSEGKVTRVEGKNQVGEGFSEALRDYPEDEPPTYDNGNIMAEMVRRAEEQRSILRHGYA